MHVQLTPATATVPRGPLAGRPGRAALVLASWLPIVLAWRCVRNNSLVNRALVQVGNIANPVAAAQYFDPKPYLEVVKA